jgi:hypothetical protein
MNARHGPATGRPPRRSFFAGESESQPLGVRAKQERAPARLTPGDHLGLLAEVRRAHPRPRGLEEGPAEPPSDPGPVRGQALHVVKHRVARGRRDAALRRRLHFEDIEREIHRRRPDRLRRRLSKVEGGPGWERTEGEPGGKREQRHGREFRAAHGAPLSGTTATGIAVRRGARPFSDAASAVIT